MRVYNGVMGFIRGLTGSSVAVDDNQHQAPPGNYIAIDMSALQPVADLAADRQASADFLAPVTQMCRLKANNYGARRPGLWCCSIMIRSSRHKSRETTRTILSPVRP